jgi:hypothetical protein
MQLPSIHRQKSLVIMGRADLCLFLGTYARNSYAFISMLSVQPFIFDAGTTVKNLFYPYDEITLVEGAQKLGLNGSKDVSVLFGFLDLQSKLYVIVSLRFV